MLTLSHLVVLKLWVNIMHNTIHPSLFRIYGKMRIKNGKKQYYNTLPTLKEKSDFSMYYMMFIIFHTVFLTILFLITLLIYKYIMGKKANYLRFIVIYIILVYLVYNFML